MAQFVFASYTDQKNPPIDTSWESASFSWESEFPRLAAISKNPIPVSSDARNAMSAGTGPRNDMQSSLSSQSRIRQTASSATASVIFQSSFPSVVRSISSNTVLINYWSKQNNRLFEFQPSDSIAIHIPVSLIVNLFNQSFSTQEPALNTLYRSLDHSNSQNAEKDKSPGNPTSAQNPSYSLLKSEFMVSQSVNDQGEWIEAYIEKVTHSIR